MNQRGSAHRRDESIERWLDLFYDGELRGFRKWRFERLLRRNPGLRQELETRAQMSQLIRESTLEPEGPDLWAGIAAGLQRVGKEAEAPAPWWREWLRPLRVAPALAGAAAALALFVVPSVEEPVVQAQGVVRSIVSKGRPVVVLDDSEEATIIWFLEGDPETTEEAPDGVRV